jgi:hypothetical protein|tara:strand:- start:283 stop:456 length:174 start_codon:yes stop_codon:yes gene_type:complete
MKVTLKKDVTVDNTTKLYKNTEGIVIAVNWGDGGDDRYYVEIKGKRYMINKKDIDIY